MIDYYFTKPSNRIGEYETRDAYKKLKMEAQPSDILLGDNIDVFISKKEFSEENKPGIGDMVFFTDKMRFYESSSVDDYGDSWIIGLNLIKQR